MNNRALHWFALVTASATFLLLGAGGLVTSHGVGMAVPDWPNTFGYNMFFFPVSQWVGGVFYEHTHRLIASGVGLLTTVLALWLHGTSSRPWLKWIGIALLAGAVLTIVGTPAHRSDGIVLAVTGAAGLAASFVWPRCQPAPSWLRKLGLVAFGSVVLQGVLGGLRVVLFKDQIGIFHAALAQLFFVMTCALALFTSGWWERRSGAASKNLAWNYSLLLRRLAVAGTALIFFQLILGAAMRHQHAGLAIPDFPMAYGKLWPAMDPQSIAHYNQQRVEVVDANPITGFQIQLQLLHRFVAVVIVALIGWSAWVARRELGSKHLVSRFTLVWLGAILVQGILGAATIWSNKAADIATGHVLVGAFSLGLGALLSITMLWHKTAAKAPAPASPRSLPSPSTTFGSRPAPVLGTDPL